MAPGQVGSHARRAVRLCVRSQPGWYRGVSSTSSLQWDGVFCFPEKVMFKEVAAGVDFPSMEKEILQFWKETRAFEALVEKNRGKARGSVIAGPLTANNPMGVHHAWGRTYKDLFQRF